VNSRRIIRHRVGVSILKLHASSELLSISQARKAVLSCANWTKGWIHSWKCLHKFLERWNQNFRHQKYSRYHRACHGFYPKKPVSYSYYHWKEEVLLNCVFFQYRLYCFVFLPTSFSPLILTLNVWCALECEMSLKYPSLMTSHPKELNQGKCLIVK